MAWLEAHQDLRDHPKTKRAARALGISRPQMIGHLLCLWWWCLDYAEDGNLTDFDNADIADAAEWEGEPDDFVDALLHCGPADRAGFLTNGDGLRVNDWSQYGGKYITKRNQGRDRQRTYRERNAEVTRYTGVSNTPREEERREEDITGQERKGEDTTKRTADFAAAVAAWEAGGLTLSKTIADDIGEAVDHWAAKGYGHYVADAIEEATRQGKLTWAYVMGILRGCERDQRAPSNKAGRNGTDPAKSKQATGTIRQASPDGSEWIYTDIATGKVARREPRETEELF